MPLRIFYRKSRGPLGYVRAPPLPPLLPTRPALPRALPRPQPSQHSALRHPTFTNPIPPQADRFWVKGGFNDWRLNAFQGEMTRIPDNECVWFEVTVPDKSEAYSIDFVFCGARARGAGGWEAAWRRRTCPARGRRAPDRLSSPPSIFLPLALRQRTRTTTTTTVGRTSTSGSRAG